MSQSSPQKNYSQSLIRRAEAELELRRRADDLGVTVELLRTGATDAQVKEWKKCQADPGHFIHNYCQIYDATVRDWIPFHLWDAQFEVVTLLIENKQVVILKARQLGLTWLVLAYALWMMLFRPAATVLLFSLRDDEAVYLLDERLKGMHRALPAWLQQPIAMDAKHAWGFANGSNARAFPTSAGDSYTATLAIVDEADLVPDLNRLMRSVKPTIDGGGQLILLSRVNKSLPESEFKKIYQAAKKKLTKWAHIFLPWYVRPSRTPEWYEEQKADILARTGSLDDLHEQYPATDIEALSPRTLDKRIPPSWLQQCYQEMEPLAGIDHLVPAIPGLRVFKLPEAGRTYVVSGDPAEGNPTSDDSASCVMDEATGEQVAVFNGKWQPAVFADFINQLAIFYNGAAILIERNNHGHAVLLWLNEHSELVILKGWDGNLGWLSNQRGKALLYNDCADAFRLKQTILRDFASYNQLASIDGSTLRAPEGQFDDLADAYAFCIVARALAKQQPSFGLPGGGQAGTTIDLKSVLAKARREG